MLDELGCPLGHVAEHAQLAFAADPSRCSHRRWATARTSPQERLGRRRVRTCLVFPSRVVRARRSGQIDRRTSGQTARIIRARAMVFTRASTLVPQSGSSAGITRAFRSRRAAGRRPSARWNCCDARDGTVTAPGPVRVFIRRTALWLSSRTRRGRRDCGSSRGGTRLRGTARPLRRPRCRRRSWMSVCSDGQLASRLPLHRTRLDQRPRAVTDGSHRLAARGERRDERHRVVVDPQLVGVGRAAGQHQCVEVGRIGLGDRPVGCEGVRRVDVALDRLDVVVDPARRTPRSPRLPTVAPGAWSARSARPRPWRGWRCAFRRVHCSYRADTRLPWSPNRFTHRRCGYPPDMSAPPMEPDPRNPLDPSEPAPGPLDPTGPTTPEPSPVPPGGPAPGDPAPDLPQPEHPGPGQPEPGDPAP